MNPVWRNRDYMLLWGGQVVSTTGSAAAQIIYPLLILALTGSPAAAGLAGALRFAPYLVFSLPVGALIDRWDRKRVMVIADIGRLVAVGSIPVAMALDALMLWHVYLVCAIEGTLFVFFNIAEVAALPRIVRREQLPDATAQNEAGFAAANIAGPSLGAFVYQNFGRAVPFVLDALSYAVSVASIVMIRAKFRAAPPSTERNLGAEIAGGLRWLWGKPLIRYMALLTGSLNLVNAAAPLVLIVLAKQLGASDAEIGVIFSVGGIGGIVGSLVGGRIQRRFTFSQVIVATTWLDALLFASYGLMPGALLLGVVSACIFFLMPIYNVVQFSYRVALIPDELQGRVNSIFRLLAFGFMPIGAALSGILIEGLGVAATIVILAAFQVAFALATHLNRHVRTAAPIGALTAAE